MSLIVTYWHSCPLGSTGNVMSPSTWVGSDSSEESSDFLDFFLLESFIVYL